MIVISEQYDDEKGEQRRVFDTASRYHFIHTLALLGLPMCRRPNLVRYSNNQQFIVKHWPEKIGELNQLQVIHV